MTARREDRLTTTTPGAREARTHRVGIPVRIPLVVPVLLALPLTLGTAPALAAVRTDAAPSPTPTHDMGGMDMGDMDMGGMDHDMGGMDMGGMDMPGMDHSHDPSAQPTSMPGMDHGDMPGMDHGSSSDHGDMPGMDHGSDSDHGDMPGMDEGPTPPRPRGLVLGSFAAVNGGAMGSALLLRRRNRKAPTGRRGKGKQAGGRGRTTR